MGKVEIMVKPVNVWDLTVKQLHAMTKASGGEVMMTNLVRNGEKKVALLVMVLGEAESAEAEQEMLRLIELWRAKDRGSIQ